MLYGFVIVRAQLLSFWRRPTAGQRHCRHTLTAASCGCPVSTWLSVAKDPPPRVPLTTGPRAGPAGDGHHPGLGSLGLGFLYPRGGSVGGAEEGHRAGFSGVSAMAGSPDTCSTAQWSCIAAVDVCGAADLDGLRYSWRSATLDSVPKFVLLSVANYCAAPSTAMPKMLPRNTFV